MDLSSTILGSILEKGILRPGVRECPDTVPIHTPHARTHRSSKSGTHQNCFRCHSSGWAIMSQKNGKRAMLEGKIAEASVPTHRLFRKTTLCPVPLLSEAALDRDRSSELGFVRELLERMRCNTVDKLLGVHRCAVWSCVRQMEGTPRPKGDKTCIR